MLENVHFDEARQSQLPALELLLNLGYEYISADEALLQRGGDTSNFILKNIAARKLMQINSFEQDGVQFSFSEKDVHDAIDALEHVPYEGLIDTAQNVFNTIMPTSGGRTVQIQHAGKKMSKNFRYIDFQHPDNNSFHVTAEFVVTGKSTIRPDIVCFVNGIPFAVIENKKSSVELSEALNQMYRNQGAEFCPKLFTFTQLLVGSNGKELQYGTTGTPNKFYMIWKERPTPDAEIEARLKKLIAKKIDAKVYGQILVDLNGATNGHKQKTDRLPTEQDKGILGLFEPTRMLDLTKNYILFDGGVKKISRYQQYFAIHKMLARIIEEEQVSPGVLRRSGGLLWHTQGSGKSLTMVMFVKALIEKSFVINPRVIIVTDRKDLDKQIRDTFQKCNLKKEVIQATSGQHLLDLIKEKNLSVITTLVHKFETAAHKKGKLVDEDSNIFVLVDEAHRSQSGIANLEMNRIIPNACYIGFTGTPLMKSEKESWKKFGGYIDKYTIDDALADGVILPLIYEGRFVDLVQNAEQIDKHVSRITEGLNTKQKKELQKYVGTKIIKDNPQRIAEIALDVEKHFVANFQHTGLKAQIVAPSKFSAVLFQKAFVASGKINTAVVISDEHDVGDDSDVHKHTVVEYLNTIRERHVGVAKYEKDVIDSFKYNEDGVEIIIVVDKLLTGFDAPCDTVLYLAKDLKDHNLLQAIARVNRLFDNAKLPKTAGYIIDYSENAKNIDTAMKLFGNYDENDVKSALTDVSDKIYELEQSFSAVHDVLKDVGDKADDEAYLRHLEDGPRREMYYQSVNEFMRNMNECFVLQDFVHQFKHLDLYQRELKKFLELKKASSLKYADTVDLGEYKQSLVNILDKYVDAGGVELLTQQINISDRKQFAAAIESLGSDKSKAEAIAAQTQKTIRERMDTDPEFYDRFSKKISELLMKLREGKMSDVKVLEQMKLIEDDVLNKKDIGLPAEIVKIKGADIFFRNLREAFVSLKLPDTDFVVIVLALYAIVKEEAIVDWQKNIDAKRRIMSKVDDYLYDVVGKGMGLQLSDVEIKNIIDSVLSLSENNYEIFS